MQVFMEQREAGRCSMGLSHVVTETAEWACDRWGTSFSDGTTLSPLGNPMARRCPCEGCVRGLETGWPGEGVGPPVNHDVSVGM